ncbi:MAG: 6,7-dimethyl-8-ribityllumazine synthase [Niabella sp.]
MASQGNSTLYDMDKGILKKDAFIVLVKTEWNAAVVDELENGCRRVLEKYGVRWQTIIVPGCVEIPFAVKRFWDRNHETVAPDAFIALGTVIRGDTPHFDYVCQMVSDGISRLNLMLPVPTIFGILTVNNEQQALERIGGVHGHKGEEAAITALKMIG